MNKIEHHISELNRLKEKLICEIRNLPQNKNLKALSKSVRAYHINPSDIGNGPLVAEYHDFLYQYERIARRLENMPLETFFDQFVKSRIFTDTADQNKTGRYMGIRLNPEVIKNIRSCLNNL